ncbi:MAG: protease complex subunit PrcB family protein [Planctomycetota bacterium]
MPRLPLALLACLLPALTTCADSDRPDPIPTPQQPESETDAPAAGDNRRELARGQHSRYDARSGSQVLVLRDKQEFATFWAQHTDTDEQPMPTVDFTTELVIAAIDQQRTSGGYAVAVDTITEHDGTITGISVTTRHPGPRTMTTSVMTRPFHIIAYPRPETH